MIYFVEFVDHLVEILKVVSGVFPPRFVRLDFTKLQNSFGQVCIPRSILLSARILLRT